MASKAQRPVVRVAPAEAPRHHLTESEILRRKGQAGIHEGGSDGEHAYSTGKRQELKAKGEGPSPIKKQYQAGSSRGGVASHKVKNAHQSLKRKKS